MNIERLQHLIEVMRNVDNHKLDMTVWVGDIPGNNSDNLCQTEKCALGWAAVDPEFNEQGLHLNIMEDYGGSEGEECISIYASPQFGYYSGYTAACEFFDLSFNQARHIFHPFHYYNVDEGRQTNDSDAVIQHINDVLKGDVT